MLVVIAPAEVAAAAASIAIHRMDVSCIGACAGTGAGKAATEVLTHPRTTTLGKSPLPWVRVRVQLITFFRDADGAPGADTREQYDGDQENGACEHKNPLREFCHGRTVHKTKQHRLMLRYGPRTDG